MILRRMDTPENRAYWESVERIAHEVRRDPHFHMICPKPQCHYSETETCEQVIARELQK
jgi:hypothetical protein